MAPETGGKSGKWGNNGKSYKQNQRIRAQNQHAQINLPEKRHADRAGSQVCCGKARC
ncbi:hypothetical protein [Leisingera sp. ANG-M1]|uniref:hypothetical protein n=1 Tax=Leisingera sp. ANG-M1 TaxID=1577895 RepID=UPI000A85A57D|nr:hypothetical protein [Leisingera sp. ANG-M1]